MTEVMANSPAISLSTYTYTSMPRSITTTRDRRLRSSSRDLGDWPKWNPNFANARSLSPEGQINTLDYAQPILKRAEFRDKLEARARLRREKHGLSNLYSSNPAMVYRQIRVLQGPGDHDTYAPMSAHEAACGAHNESYEAQSGAVYASRQHQSHAARVGQHYPSSPYASSQHDRLMHRRGISHVCHVHSKTHVHTHVQTDSPYVPLDGPEGRDEASQSMGGSRRSKYSRAYRPPPGVDAQTQVYQEELEEAGGAALEEVVLGTLVSRVLREAVLEVVLEEQGEQARMARLLEGAGVPPGIFGSSGSGENNEEPEGIGLNEEAAEVIEVGAEAPEEENAEDPQPEEEPDAVPDAEEEAAADADAEAPEDQPTSDEAAEVDDVGAGPPDDEENAEEAEPEGEPEEEPGAEAEAIDEADLEGTVEEAADDEEAAADEEEAAADEEEAAADEEEAAADEEEAAADEEEATD